MRRQAPQRRLLVCLALVGFDEQAPAHGARLCGPRRGPEVVGQHPRAQRAAACEQHEHGRRPRVERQHALLGVLNDATAGRRRGDRCVVVGIVGIVGGVVVVLVVVVGDAHGAGLPARASRTGRGEVEVEVEQRHGLRHREQRRLVDGQREPLDAQGRALVEQRAHAVRGTLLVEGLVLRRVEARRAQAVLLRVEPERHVLGAEAGREQAGHDRRGGAERRSRRAGPAAQPRAAVGQWHGELGGAERRARQQVDIGSRHRLFARARLAGQVGVDAGRRARRRAAEGELLPRGGERVHGRLQAGGRDGSRRQAELARRQVGHGHCLERGRILGQHRAQVQAHDLLDGDGRVAHELAKVGGGVARAPSTGDGEAHVPRAARGRMETRVHAGERDAHGVHADAHGAVRVANDRLERRLPAAAAGIGHARQQREQAVGGLGAGLGGGGALVERDQVDVVGRAGHRVELRGGNQELEHRGRARPGAAAHEVVDGREVLGVGRGPGGHHPRVVAQLRKLDLLVAGDDDLVDRAELQGTAPRVGLEELAVAQAHDRRDAVRIHGRLDHRLQRLGAEVRLGQLVAVLAPAFGVDGGLRVHQLAQTALRTDERHAPHEGRVVRGGVALRDRVLKDGRLHPRRQGANGGVDGVRIVDAQATVQPTQRAEDARVFEATVQRRHVGGDRVPRQLAAVAVQDAAGGEGAASSVPAIDDGAGCRKSCPISASGATPTLR